VAQTNPSAPPRLARGLTLIELMIGVALVAILVLIALPRYNDYRDKVRSRQAADQIAAIAVLARTYYNDARAYPDSLADLHMDTLRDPWGRPYVYYNIDANGKGHARKDHALNPLNTDFDLYSLGPDGKTKSQITQKDSLDDVIRASDGAFIGIASDF
jgi:general secretion pathway protein G